MASEARPPAAAAASSSAFPAEDGISWDKVPGASSMFLSASENALTAAAAAASVDENEAGGVSPEPSKEKAASEEILLTGTSSSSATPLPAHLRTASASSALATPAASSAAPRTRSSPDELDIRLPPSVTSSQKSYDYLLKVLLVGDSDVGKGEILEDLEDGTTESPYCSSSLGAASFKHTTILIDGKRVKLQLWDTSGQGRFCTIIRSYSRGAQGILLVYDITSRWSFDGIDRWLKEVDQHAPGVPKVLVGNRLHLAFKREVGPLEAEQYAERNSMGFFEVSPLVNFNVSESFAELARMALRRNGMERLWRSNRVTSLYEACAHAIVNRTTVYGIDRLPLPESVRHNLKSYSLTSYSATLRRPQGSVPVGGGQGQLSMGGGRGLVAGGTRLYRYEKHSLNLFYKFLTLVLKGH